MTPLERLIRREIAMDGPMNVARYIELCLAHPEHGYYVTRDPLGAAGDFITAPEISQMFGEMIGAWVATVWDGMGRPDISLIELGPGRGTLMADVMRVIDRLGAPVQVWFVETSPALSAEQAKRMPAASWVDDLGDVPPGPSIILANEFFDALPVRQFLHGDRGWHERLVGANDDGLFWGLSASAPGDPATSGAWREQSAAADRVLEQIKVRLRTEPAAALVIDYGYQVADRPAGPTLQALRAHAPADALQMPGEADLTWLIDFDHVADLLGAVIAPQGQFLANMGVGVRAASLAEAAPDRAEEIADQLDRLTGADHMGLLFKVAAAASPGVMLPGM